MFDSVVLMWDISVASEEPTASIGRPLSTPPAPPVMSRSTFWATALHVCVCVCVECVCGGVGYINKHWYIFSQKWITKLWLFNIIIIPVSHNYYQNFSNGHNFSSGDPISMIFWFSESLKGALSVGTFKSILFLTDFCQNKMGYGPW